MKVFNPRHFLRHIAMPTLREFVEAHILGPRLIVDWAAPPQSLADAVCQAVDGIAAELRDPQFDASNREAIESELLRWHEDLRRAHLMSTDLAIREFHSACVDDPQALEAFASISEREVALWMLAFRDKVFRETELHLAFQAKANGKYWKRNRIQVGLKLVREKAHLDEFGRAVRELYEKSGGGLGSHVDVFDRLVDGSVQLAIYVEGPLTSRMRFTPSGLATGATRLVLETAIVYHPCTGIVETVVKGGAKNHVALLRLFGTHVVNREITYQEIECQQFDLNALRDGMMDPSEDWTHLGVRQVRLRRATYSPVGCADVCFEVEASSSRIRDDAARVALTSLKFQNTFESEYDMIGAGLIVYTRNGDGARDSHFSFNVFASGASTIKNLSERNQPIANAVLAALNVTARQPSAAG